MNRFIFYAMVTIAIAMSSFADSAPKTEINGITKDHPNDSAGSPSVPRNQRKMKKNEKKKTDGIAEYSSQGHFVKVRFSKSGKMLTFENKHLVTTAEKTGELLANKEYPANIGESIKKEFELGFKRGYLKKSDKIQIDISYRVSDQQGFIRVNRAIEVNNEGSSGEALGSGGGLSIYDAAGDIVFAESRREIWPLHPKGYFIVPNTDGYGGTVIDSKNQNVVPMPFSDSNHMSENGRYLLQVDDNRVIGSYRKFAIADLEQKQVRNGREMITDANRNDAWLVGDDGIIKRKHGRFDDPDAATTIVKVE